VLDGAQLEIVGAGRRGEELGNRVERRRILERDAETIGRRCGFGAGQVSHVRDRRRDD
jgi:hypothetical protein